MATPNGDAAAVGMGGNGGAPPPDGGTPMQRLYAEVLELREEVRECAALTNSVQSEQMRQGKVLSKVAVALGIDPGKSEPPPDFRGSLISIQDEVKHFRGEVDGAEDTARRAALDAAKAERIASEARAWNRKTAMRVAKVAAGLAGLSTAVWAVVKILEQLLPH